MIPLLFFLLKSVCVSGLLYGCYLLILKNTRLYQYNRFYLLATALAGLILPLLQFSFHFHVPSGNSTVITMLQVISEGGTDEITNAATHSYFTLSNTGIAIYCMVALGIVAVTIKTIFWIYKTKSQHPIKRANGVEIVHTNLPSAPFSFMNMLFWNDAIAQDSDTGKQILRHELAHISQRHTLDKLFMQLAVAIAWANPIYWLLQKELSLVQEFIADEAALGAEGDIEAFARMLLQSHFSITLPNIVHPFFHSPIKRRIVMLCKPNTTMPHLRRAMIVPVLSLAACLVSFTISPRAAATRVAGNKVKVVFDAGHGGNDNGGTSTSGLAEKDLNLKISQRLAALSPEYNIDAVQTRNDDNYLPLAQRVAVADQSGAAVFVSIHVTKTVPSTTPIKDYELCVSHKAAQFEQSQVLASAIGNQFSTIGISAEVSDRSLVVLRDNNRPAVLIECGNIDNSEEMTRLESDQKADQFCRKILSGIVAYENSLKK